MRRERYLSGLIPIRVVGVGGSGGNAVNRMIAEGVQGVEYLVIDTDAAALAASSAPTRINISGKGTCGPGTGGSPRLAERAAYKARAQIWAALAGTAMLFITACMGGGTSTGAAPIIAEIARDLGILTIAIVTRPFLFEGGRPARLAEAGIEALKNRVDTLIVIPNDRLSALSGEQAGLAGAFRLADDVLRQGVQAISELLTLPGLMNVDFADIQRALSGQGPGLMAFGHASGEDRACLAAEQAVHSPLLGAPLDGASHLLVNITAGSEINVREIEEACEVLKRAAHPDANIILGAAVNEAMRHEMRVALIATGFADAAAARRPSPQVSCRSAQLEPQPQERTPRISLRDYTVPPFFNDGE